MEDINVNIANYKKQLQSSNIQETYKFLFDYFWHLKSHFAKNILKDYSVGNISPGYMDYTYFPFYNESLRKCKLRFGLVLNHKEMQFELWLMGQNVEVQRKYWDKLKHSKWNQFRKVMPQYSVLESILVNDSDFSKLEVLTESIAQKISVEVSEIIIYLNK